MQLSRGTAVFLLCSFFKHTESKSWLKNLTFDYSNHRNADKFLQFFTIDHLRSIAANRMSSRCSKLLYGIFTTCTLHLTLFLLLTQLLNIILFIDNVDDFITISLTSIQLFTIMCKELVTIIRRGDQCAPDNAKQAFQSLQWRRE